MSVAIEQFQTEMDHAHSDDKMEVATSPYRVVDDIELDEDPIHDPFTDNQMIVTIDHTAEELDPMQADSELPYHDDDMLDDEDANNEFAPQVEESVAPEFEMEAYDQYERQEAEDEILLDEDETYVTMQDDAVDPAIDQDVPTTEAYVEEGDTIAGADEIQEEELYEDHAINTNESTTNSTLPPGNQTMEDQQNLDLQPGAELDRSNESFDNAIAGNRTELSPTGAYQQHNSSLPYPESRSGSPGEGESNQESLVDQRHLSAGPDQAAERTLEHNVSDNQSKVPTTSNPSVDVESAHHVAPRAALSESDNTTYPVSIVYLGQRMSLFPPSEGDSESTFLLLDKGLAQKPFDKLLEECRNVLGESLEHDDEMVLDVPFLGLHVDEYSRCASQISLSEVIEVYTALSRNEGITVPPPLECSLSSRVRLSTQYAYLTSAACEGKFLSAIAAEHMDSPKVEEEEYDDELVEGPPDSHEHPLDGPELEDEHQHDDSVVNDGNTEQSDMKAPEAEHQTADVSSQLLLDGQTEIIEEKLAAEDIDAHEELQDESHAKLVQDAAGHDAGQALAEADDLDDAVDLAGIADETTITEGHEDAHTPSSHTIEADEHVATRTPTQTDASLKADETDANEPDLHEEDDLSYSDDEFLDEEQNDDIEAAEHADEGEEDLFAAKPEAEGALNTQSPRISADLGQELNGHAAADGADLTPDVYKPTPITPSKQSRGKRKALEDNDDDNLVPFDLDTPDAKRLRP